mgnify:FL=1|jgi:hypothetical protein
MFTCKQVSNSLNQKNFQDFPLWKRVLIKLHVKCCVFCGKYNSQVIDTHNMCRELIKNEKESLESDCCDICLDKDNKEALKEKIRQST